MFSAIFGHCREMLRYVCLGHFSAIFLLRCCQFFFFQDYLQGHWRVSKLVVCSMTPLCDVVFRRKRSVCDNLWVGDCSLLQQGNYSSVWLFNDVLTVHPFALVFRRFSSAVNVSEDLEDVPHIINFHILQLSCEVASLQVEETWWLSSPILLQGLMKRDGVINLHLFRVVQNHNSGHQDKAHFTRDEQDN